MPNQDEGSLASGTPKSELSSPVARSVMPAWDQRHISVRYLACRAAIRRVAWRRSSMQRNADIPNDQQEQSPGHSLVIASIVLAVLASLYLLLAPGYHTEAMRVELGGGPPVTTRDRATLLVVEGWKVVRLLLLPILISAVPLFLRATSAALAVRSLAALLLVGFVLLGLASIGFFYFPSAIAMGIAALAILRPRPFTSESRV